MNIFKRYTRHKRIRKKGHAKRIGIKRFNTIVKVVTTFVSVFIITYAFSYERSGGGGKYENQGISDVFSSSTEEDYENFIKENENVEKDTKLSSFEDAIKEGMINNVYISKVEGNKVTLFYNNEEREFKIANADELKEYTGWLCDVQTEDEIIAKVSFNSTKTKDYFLYAKDDYIVFENAGKVAIGEACAIIKRTDNSRITMSDVTLSNERMEVDLFTKEGKVNGMVFDAPNLETISVLIKNNDYTKIQHENISISSKNGIIIKTYTNSEKPQITNSNNISISTKDNFNRIIITGKANALLSIDSMKRCEGVTYHGSITIIKTKEGLIMVNSLPLEKYLYGVLPSEMPSSAPMESFMAQAVCARTYALDKMRDYKYKEYGAAVDDSTSFQVYNKNPRTKEAIQAVDKTKGLVLVYKEKLAKTYYFSTSCGSVASAKEVFGGNADTGNMITKTQSSYNALQKSYENMQNINLSSEKEFISFIDSYIEKESDREECIEENCYWFRWNTTFSLKELEKRHINSEWDVGEIKEITVDKREKSGLVSAIKVVGKGKEIAISGQNNIRKYFAPASEKVICTGASEEIIRENMKLLPSGFFYIKELKEEKIRLIGGGYGHGTGMSQYGAMQLAGAGFSCEEILMHYFTDCIVVDSVTRLVNP